MGDEVWQLSKDSADAATAPTLVLYGRPEKGGFLSADRDGERIGPAEPQSVGVGRQRESKKRNQNRNRGSLITVHYSFQTGSGPFPVGRMSRREGTEPSEVVSYIQEDSFYESSYSRRL